MLSIIQKGLTSAVKPKSIIVVGAGMAGLVAATLLKHAGHKVTVLEADSRIGGRVLTVRAPFSDGLLFEAGASRIPSNHYLSWELLKKYRLHTYPLINTTPNDLFYLNAIKTNRKSYEQNPDIVGFAVSKSEKSKTAAQLLKEVVTPIAPYFTHYLPMSQLIEQLNHYTLDTFLQDPPFGKPLSPGAIEKIKVILGIQGFSEYSAFHILQVLWPWYEEQITFHAVKGGNDQLPTTLASEIKDDIYINERVNEIHATETNVTIHSFNTIQSTISLFHADRVILAVPFSTLKLIDIRPKRIFTNEKWRAIRGLRYVPLSRIAIEFKKRFWEEQGFFGGQTITDLPLRFSFLPSQGIGSRGPAVMTASYTLGADTLPWEVLSPNDRLTTILQQLATLYGEAVYNEFVTSVAVNWRQHPFIKGGFGIIKAGDVRQFGQHMSTAEHNFHFAGEHTSTHPGWIEGAVESGIRAAFEVHHA